MKANIIFYSLLALIFGIWVYAFHYFYGYLEFGHLFLSAFGTIVTILIIYAILGIIWRINNGVDVFATLETDPEKVKERMLFVMQYGHHNGLKGALEEFKDIFRNYPQWHFQNWVVFRAWYKNMIDGVLREPDIYHLTMDDGEPYIKEEDPLYDPDAPTWEQFDRHHYYDINEEDDEDDEENDEDYDGDDGDDEDDDEDYDGDDDEDSGNELKKSAGDGFYFGLGFGAGHSILN